ncbi:MAG: NAD(P)H-hydrate epimerase [Candidatus Omnitrophota bacterium]
MKTVTAEEMKRIDREAVEKYGIPAVILMENAAISAAFCVLQMLKTTKDCVTFFCGQGNNGGDGFACARHLLNRGIKITVYFAGEKERLTEEAKINYEILRRMGQDVLKPDLMFINQELAKTDLIVDALLGIGLKEKVREPYYSLIMAINASAKPVLALDIPSGLDATSGKICGIAVRARQTVTFGFFKKGLLSPQAKKYTGKIIVGDIGLPRKQD